MLKSLLIKLLETKNKECYASKTDNVDELVCTYSYKNYFYPHNLYVVVRYLNINNRESFSINIKLYAKKEKYCDANTYILGEHLDSVLKDFVINKMLGHLSEPEETTVLSDSCTHRTHYTLTFNKLKEHHKELIRKAITDYKTKEELKGLFENVIFKWLVNEMHEYYKKHL